MAEAQTLTEFLLARIAEDEAEARERREIADRRWAEIRAAGAMPGIVVFRTAEPEFTLAQCAADRRIVEMHRREHECPDVDHNNGLAGWFGGDTGPCPTLAALALPYADHPDCREEWRP